MPLPTLLYFHDSLSEVEIYTLRKCVCFFLQQLPVTIYLLLHKTNISKKPMSMPALNSQCFPEGQQCSILYSTYLSLHFAFAE